MNNFFCILHFKAVSFFICTIKYLYLNKNLSIKSEEEKKMGEPSYNEMLYESLRPYAKKVSEALRETGPPLEANLQKAGKHMEASIIYRKRGNALFKNKVYLEAIASYTRSIRSSHNRSEELGLAYFKRAAVFMKTGFYIEALQDLTRAADLIPNDKADDVKLRLEEAEVRGPKEQEPYHLRRPWINEVYQNEFVLSGTKAIEVRKDEKSSFSYVHAARDLTAGDLLVVEKPFVIAVREGSCFLCNECGKRVLNPIPCGNCSEVQYCSDECSVNAWRNYHCIECVIKDIIKPYYADYGLAIKVVLSIRDYNTPPVEDGKYHSNRYKEILELQHDLEDCDKFPDVARTAAEFYKALVLCQFTKSFRAGHKEDILRGLILKTMLIVKKGRYQRWSLEKKIDDTSVFKTSWYSLGSLVGLMDHACLPNAIAYQSGDVIVIRALYHVPKGEKLTVAYGFTYLNCPLESRILTLKENYNISCNCEACLEDYPVFEDLPYKNPNCPYNARLTSLEKTVNYVFRTRNYDAIEYLYTESLGMYEKRKWPFNTREMALFINIIMQIFRKLDWYENSLERFFNMYPSLEYSLWDFRNPRGNYAIDEEAIKSNVRKDLAGHLETYFHV